MVERCAVLLTGALVLAGCHVDPEILTLNDICFPAYGYNVEGESAQCYVTFDAEMADGAADGMVAARLGPNGGELHVLLGAFLATRELNWSLDVLVESTSDTGSLLIRSVTWGSCGSECPPEPGNVEVDVADELTWAQVVDDAVGSSSSQIPNTAEVVFAGADIDIFAFRTPGSNTSNNY
jgi:hypothetical protein